MSSTVISHGAAHHDAHDHHHETFLTKYIFSQDHKIDREAVFDYRYRDGGFRYGAFNFIPYPVSMAGKRFPNLRSLFR